MRFSHDDILRFAEWSGDRNPLHVDPAAAQRTFFGRPVVHGMLSALRALSVAPLDRAAVRRLDIDFRGAVFPDASCTLEQRPAPSGAVITVSEGSAALLTIQVNGERQDHQPDREWLGRGVSADAALPRTAPAVLEADSIQPGLQVVGLYPAPPADTGMAAAGPLSPTQARVLGLCSYVVGMEIPGLRSLFTRLSLTFLEAPADAGDLMFCARVVRFDEHFRMADVRLDVATAGGVPVATAELRSYVRFSPVDVSPSTLALHLEEGADRLAGKVALVCGGTRGLGAQITAALAMAGCHVFASYQRDREEAEALAAALQKAGTRIETFQGHAGDPAWCRQALDAIEERYGRLDVLVLNACAAPGTLRLDAGSAFTEYVTQNLALAQVPLATCLPALARSEGTVVCISSSFVADPPVGFGHYVALKEAVEATVRVAVRETDRVRAIVARPPRLQTAWNDTPTGVLGTIPASQAAVHVVRRLAAGAAGRHEVLADFPALPRVQPTVSPAAPEFSIAIAASFTPDPLLTGLRFWFAELGVSGDVQFAPYGQIIQTLLTPSAGLSRPPLVQVVLLRVSDWLRELRDRDRQSDDALQAHLEAAACDFERAMRAHRSQAAAETLLVLCPSAPASAGPAASAVAAIESEILSRLANLPGLSVIRAQQLHERYRIDEAAVADPVRDKLAHIPYQAPYFHALATMIVRHVHRKLAPARKVVVVDCDNTLWQGVVGEVGAEGVRFEAAHRALHQRLAELNRSGVLVALCSKNEEADVWSVFDTRRDCLLPRDAIVLAMINWQPKSANIRAIAARLNLGLDSFLFIDDNPVECAEVRAACPEVLTIEWPQDPDQAVQLLEHTWELDPRPSTVEDRRRGELYREEFRRQELQAQLTFRDFIASLELSVQIQPLVPEDLKRASQLTLRTNQFNFTTHRRDESELQALMTAGAHEIRTVRVRDRFGDYGLVGLLIAEPRGTELVTDTFLLSCRVLGRGVEHQMVAELGRLAAGHGLDTVRLSFSPTSRNTPARSFLETIISPEHRRAGAAGTIEAAFPAARAEGLTFEPPDAVAPAPVDEDTGKASAHVVDAARLRRREAQIRRTASALSTPGGLAAAVDGGAAVPAGGVEPAIVDAEYVYEAFARALNASVAHVREIDSLDALGCDSFKIVEITVGLLERYPSLPATLLFEHRSVSEIAKRIAALADGPPPQLSVSASATADQGEPAGADIAVVGMHLRCAGANSPDELWELLRGGQVAVAPVPADRKYFLGRLEDRREHFAGMLEDLDRFDAELFGIAPREAELMDPQLRLFLEVAWGALEDAGCLGDTLEPDTGVFAGVMYGDYAYRANVVARATGNPLKCWEDFSLANRLSQVFGFHGPSVAVDTACSSSGTALHLACRALSAGDCRMALVGGVNLILDPDRLVQLGRLGILSTAGRCLAFGAEADGTVLGEGAGVVVLRPLAEALRRGDRVYGVIKATAVSTGSGTVGFTAPNPQAQALAIRRALRGGHIDPRTITYVETHGTGTALGDPIELRGLTIAYEDIQLWDPRLTGRPTCGIGSIKPNIGHLEAGAGVLGLIKLLLQLDRRTLLPSLTSEKPNPLIPFADSRFAIQRTGAPWDRPLVEVAGTPAPMPRRGALNSFGVGGANVHVVVEEAPEVLRPAVTDRPQHLLALSARTEDALRKRADELATFLASSPDVPLADVCFAANTGHRHLGQRAALVAGRREELIAALTALASGSDGASGTPPLAAGPPGAAFLFTGQGAQYAGMGRELYATQPVFREALDRCFALFAPLLPRSLRDVMFADDGAPEAALLDQTGYTQPALFSIGYALSELWQSWGVRPAVVLGHSIGELTAMCVAGGLSLEDAVTVVAARGRLMQALPSGGSMVSVMAPAARVADLIAACEGRVAIAAVNAPQQTVLSGDEAALAGICARLASEAIKHKPLVVSHAFHSPLMEPMLPEYEQCLRAVRFRRPSVPFVSCVLGRAAAEELTEPSYWLRNVLDPVRFTDGIRAVSQLEVGALLEMGPQPVLVGLARQCADASEGGTLWLPSLRRDAGWVALLSSLGALYTAGAEIDWRGFDRPFPRRRVSLPPYPFGGRRYWIAASVEAAVSTAREPESVRPDADVYEVRWQLQPAAIPAHRATGNWLVVGDAGELGGAIAEALRRKGGRPTLVDSPETALDRMAASAGPDSAWRGVIHVPERSPAPRPGWNAAASAAAGVEAVAALMRAVSAPERTAGRLWVVTRLAVKATAAEIEIAADHGALWGIGRTFALEHPSLWGGLIDVTPGTPARIAADLILDELLSDTGEDQVAIRPDGRRVPRLVRAAQASSPAFSLTPDATYLITGGCGALGLHAARWLVRAGARALVLTGRGGAAAKTAKAALSELESAGARVRVVAADVSQVADVRRLLEQFDDLPPLRGIVHAAGVDEIRPIRELAPGDAERVMAAKVHGAWMLHEASLEMPLDFFICFSSIASILGSAGRPAYAAANAFLDALAHQRQQMGLPALAINWGPWSGGGMATAAALDGYRHVGNYGLDPHRSVALLQQLVQSHAGHAMIASIDWTLFKPAYAARRPRHLLDEVGTPIPGGVPPAAPSVTAPWVARLAKTGAEHRFPELVSLLREEIAQTLGFERAADVSAERPFQDMGMDSLMSADFAQRLHKHLGIRNSALVFEYPTVNALATQLLKAAGLDQDVSLAVAAAVPETAVTTVPAGASPGGRGAGRSVPAAPRSADFGGRPNGAAERYSQAVEPEVFEFAQQAWPARRRELIAPRWRWMFVDSARRLGVEPGVWLHRESGVIVGHNGAIPVRVHVRGQERTSAWLVDTMVLEDFRSQAVGVRLMAEAHQDVPFALSLGQTAQMRAIQLRLGWEQVAPLQTAQLLLRPERVLKGKLSAPAAAAAGLGLRAASALRDAWRPAPRHAARAVGRFDARHDALWAAMSRTVTCAVRRDASYLNWKYVDQPGQEFLRLEVVGDSGVRAVVVAMMRAPDEAYQYQRGFIVDIVAPLDDPALLDGAIQAAIGVLAERGADAVWCLHANPALTAGLRRANFRFRAPSRFLLVRPGPIAEPLRTDLLTAGNWFVTQGDSDIDRP